VRNLDLRDAAVNCRGRANNRRFELSCGGAAPRRLVLHL
jgi:hypothetical protein